MTLIGSHIALVALASLRAQGLDAGPMTMDRAVLIAERNAFAVQLQKTTVEKDRQGVFLALANMGPTIGINPVFSQTGQQITESFGPGTPPVVVSPFYTAPVGANLNLPIDISGNLHRLWGASQFQHEGALRTLQATFNDARLNARSAFLSVLRNQALVGVAEQTLKDAQGRLDQANLQFKQEQIAKVDVDRLDAQVAQSVSDLLTAQNTLQLSIHAFNQVLARPIETPVELVEVNELPAIPTNRQDISLNAQRFRPESRSLEDQMRSLALIRRAEEAGMEPSLALALGYQRSLNSGAFTSPSSTTMTLSLNVPVFDSGATRARVKGARQDELAAKIQLEQTQLGISQEVSDAFANLVNAKARQANAQRQVTLAEEVFRLAQVRQNAGEGTYVEVVDAQTTLSTARNTLVSAKYDYFLAWSQLQHGVGNDDVQQPATGNETNVALTAAVSKEAVGGKQ